MGKTIKARLVRLAHERPEFRASLMPIITADWGGDELVGGREWDKGQSYGPPYGPNFKLKDPPKNPCGSGRCPKCKYMGGEEKCYTKRDVGVKPSKDKAKYNREYRKKYVDRTVKAAALKSQLIRLAHAHPEFQGVLLPLLRG